MASPSLKSLVQGLAEHGRAEFVQLPSVMNVSHAFWVRIWHGDAAFFIVTLRDMVSVVPPR